MSIALSFIRQGRQIEEELATAPSALSIDPEFLAEDYDSAIKHAVSVTRRMELGRQPWERIAGNERLILDNVVADLTEAGKLRGLLRSADYDRGTVALIVAQGIKWGSD